MSRNGRSARNIALAMLLGLSATPAQGRVVVIGVDGGSWNIVDEMREQGELPNLSALARRGIHAELETVEPVTSPVVWTSIATGRTPEDHGVGDFYTTRASIRTPTSYERLAALGLRVGLYDVLMTWPPVTLPDGFVIPGWLRRDDRVTPPDVWKRVPHSPFVVHYDDLYTNGEYLALAEQEVARKAARWNALAEEFDLDVGAVTFYAADMTSHRFWRAARPHEFEDAGPPAPAAHRTAIARAMRGIDRSIGEIVASASPEDTVIVVSDHGFQALEEPRPVWTTRFDALLGRAGLDPDRDAFSLLSEFGGVILSIERGPIAERDALADRLVALLESCSSADGEPLFDVNLLDTIDRPPEAQRQWSQRLRQWVVGLVVRYWFGVEPDRSGHAVVFALPRGETLESLWPDGAVKANGEALSVAQLMSRQDFSGGHDPVGILLAAGGPIRHVAERQRASVLEIAPLLFYLSGRDIPDDLPGGLRRDWIGPDRLTAQPPRRIAADALPALPAESATATPAPDEEALTDKLRALGYVE